MFPNNFQCSAVQRGWSAGIMYIRGLAGLPGERGATVGADERVDRCGRGRGGVTAILFSGVIFYQHRQPSALTNPSTPLPTPIWLASRHPLAAPIPTGLYYLLLLLLYLSPLPRTPHGGHPLPLPPTNLATVSVLNHICDAFFSFLFFHKAGL